MAEFFDTNVLVYEWDVNEQAKREKAQRLVTKVGAQGVVSSQVFQEFAWTASQKLKLTGDEVVSILQNYARFRYVPIEARHVQLALLTAETSKIRFWDALIVEAAAATGCRTLYTEDLNQGQIIRGVKIVNPFL